MSYSYKFLRGDRVKIVSGKHKGANGTVDAKVFQRSVDSPDEQAPSYHVVLGDGTVVKVNVQQVDLLD